MFSKKRRNVISIYVLLLSHFGHHFHMPFMLSVYMRAQGIAMLKLLVTILTGDWFLMHVHHIVMFLNITHVIKLSATFRAEELVTSPIVNFT